MGFMGHFEPNMGQNMGFMGNMGNMGNICSTDFSHFFLNME